MSVRFIVVCSVLLTASLFAQGGVQKRESHAHNRADSLFSVNEYKGHLDFLAHDLLEGRATGDRGAALAAAYIAAQFRILGLKPFSSEEGYLQTLRLTGFKTDYDSLHFSLVGRDGPCLVEPLTELCVNGECQTDMVMLDDELWFVGYGIEAQEYNWDDFKGLDVAGKVLVVLVNDPEHQSTGFGTESLSYYGRWAYKLEMARRRKAKGVILIHHEREATYNWSVVRNSWSVERLLFRETGDQALTMQAWLSHTALNRALTSSGLDYLALKKMADSRKFRPMKLPLQLKTTFRQEVRQAECSNVVGIIPGVDPQLKNEAVVYTGHYDHFGIGLPDETGDRIYNGALDNASGTAALICLARAFAMSPVRPKRTVIFLPTTGEELGLLGSTWFVTHSPWPLNQIAMVINKDCMNHLGRRDSVAAFPVEYSSALKEVRDIADARGLKLLTQSHDPWGGAFRSDHFPFAARGVPAISLGMSGAYLDRSEEEIKKVQKAIGYTYHQPSDEVHKAWVYDGVLQELELLYALGRHWADGAVKPSLNIERDNPYWATRIWYGLLPGGAEK